MNEFLQQVWLDNTVKQYLTVILVIIFVTIFRKFISKYIAAGIAFVLGFIFKHLDKKALVALVVQPFGMFLSIVVAISSISTLNFPEVFDFTIYKISFHQILQWIASITLIVSFIRLLISVVNFLALVVEKRYLRKDSTNKAMNVQFILFFKSLANALLVVIGILMTLKYAFKYDVGGLVTSLGVMSAAIAFSLKESIENLIASVIIFIDKPFHSGDSIKVSNISGTVEHIGIRSTRVRTDAKTLVTVPNKQMVDTIVDNLTLRTARRGDLKLELELSTNSEKLSAAIEGIKDILMRQEIRSANVFLTEITGSAYLIHAEYYTAPVTAAAFNSIRQEAYLNVIKFLEKKDIKIAGASSDINVVTVTRPA